MLGALLRLSVRLRRPGRDELFDQFDVESLLREGIDHFSDCFVMNRRNVELTQVDCW